ncbi:MAG TPA: hypothetical protein VMT85_04525 [Thermoanaerobaculia bacterium]|nr:hypothetical protein [Thermoanaerobaculia bacterium]
MAPSIQHLVSLHDLEPYGDEDLEGAGERTGERAASGPIAVSEPALEDLVFSARRLISSVPPAERAEERFATGIETVDRLLDGGIERGETIEIVGRRTSGRFSLVLSALAAATRRGEAAALVDLGDHLDPEAAGRAGIVVERLLWLRPQHSRTALGGAELLLAAGFPLVVLDLGQPPVPGGRGVEASWLRLQRAAVTHRGALLVSTPYRASGTAAQAVLEVDGGRGGWLGHGAERSPQLLGGLAGHLVLRKARGRLSRSAAADDRDAEFELRVPETVSRGPEGGPHEALETTIRRFVSSHRGPGWSGWSREKERSWKRTRHGG